MMKTCKTRRNKAGLLAVVTLAGGTVFASCSSADIQHNLIAGTQSFVKGYTADLWEAILPTADELLNRGGED